MSELKLLVENVKIPAYEKIGLIEAVIANLAQTHSVMPKEFLEISQMLGINTSQTERVKKQWDLAKILYDRKAPLVAVAMDGSEENPNTGVYIMQDEEGGPRAIFKATGSRRGCIETAFSNLSDILGLGSHYITGRFSALESPPSPKPDEHGDPGEIFIRLWNGNTQIFEKIKGPVVGQVYEYCPTTYIQKEPKSALKDRAELVLLLMAGGVRDVTQGNVNPDTETLYDAEESFPRRADPVICGDDKKSEKMLSFQPAITDMAYIDDELLHESFSEELISHLARIVSKWDLDEIRKTLQEQRILFPDIRAENEKISRQDEYKDDSGSLYQLASCRENYDKVNGIKTFNKNGEPIIDGLPFDIHKEKCALKDEQINATLIRIERIKCFCWALDVVFNKGQQPKQLSFEEDRALREAQSALDNGSVSIFSLIKFVEPYFAALDTVCSRSSSRFLSASPTPTSSLGLCGRCTPKGMGLDPNELLSFYRDACNSPSFQPAQLQRTKSAPTKTSSSKQESKE